MSQVNCPHCQGAVGFSPQYANQVVNCPYCSQQFQMPATLAPVAATASQAAVYRPRNGSTPLKSPGVAALLSFFFWGAGQIYNEQIAKGLLIYVLAIMIAGFGILTLGLGLVFLLPLWIWAIYDAHSVAERSNRRSRR